MVWPTVTFLWKWDINPWVRETQNQGLRRFIKKVGAGRVTSWVPLHSWFFSSKSWGAVESGSRNISSGGVSEIQVRHQRLPSQTSPYPQVPPFSGTTRCSIPSCWKFWGPSFLTQSALCSLLPCVDCSSLWLSRWRKVSEVFGTSALPAPFPSVQWCASNFTSGNLSVLMGDEEIVTVSSLGE